jgi:hypothetical protein
MKRYKISPLLHIAFRRKVGAIFHIALQRGVDDTLKVSYSKKSRNLVSPPLRDINPKMISHRSFPPADASIPTAKSGILQ